MMRSSSVQAHAAKIQRSLATVGSIIAKLRFPTRVPDKVMAALALLRASFDDAAGIVELSRMHGGELAGACFSLLRPMNEKLKRGTWLALCATDAQVREFIDHDRLPGGNEIALAIERIPPFDQLPMFSEQHKNAWKKFHDFTHGGNQVVGAYTRGSGIGAAFGDENLQTALDHVESIVVLGAQIMIMVAGEYIMEEAKEALDELCQAFMPQNGAVA